MQIGSEVLHRLLWARTYLKKLGVVNNEPREVWTLEVRGCTFLAMKHREADTAFRTVDPEVRRHLMIKDNAGSNPR